MGITGFTLATMYRWVRSEAGLEARCTRTARATTSAAARARSCSPRPGLDGESQFSAIKEFLDARSPEEGRELKVTRGELAMNPDMGKRLLDRSRRRFRAPRREEASASL